MYLSKLHRKIMLQLRLAYSGKADPPEIPLAMAEYLFNQGLIEQTLLGWHLTEKGISIPEESLL